MHASEIRRSQVFTIFPDESERMSTVSAMTNFLVVQTPQGQMQRPIGIVALCKRTNPHMHPSIGNVYQACIKNLSSQLLSARPINCGSDYGHCGNFRGSLTECRCKTLNRMSNPLIREIYENRVISRAIAAIGRQIGNFHLKIAVFASGGLHGEEVLLFRLVDAIKNLGRGGLISLFLIDRDYHPSIQQTQQFHMDMCIKGKAMWDGLVGNRADIKQFTCEISQCLPPSISVECTFFGVHQDYLTTSRMLPQQFKHHLLIGADIDATLDIVREIKDAAIDPNEDGVILIKELVQPNQEVAKLCDMRPNKNLVCVKV